LYLNSKISSKYFGAPKKSHDLNFIRERNRAPRNPSIEKDKIKIIKAPKFSNKAYEKTLKMGGKGGRNESNIDNNFCFVFQPNQATTTNKSKVRLTAKRNSVIPSMSNFQVVKENSNKNDE